jgi:hypothetical protein
MIEYAGLGVWVDNVDPELRSKRRCYCSRIIMAAEVVRRFILN